MPSADRRITQDGYRPITEGYQPGARLFPDVLPKGFIPTAPNGSGVPQQPPPPSGGSSVTKPVSKT